MTEHNTIPFHSGGIQFGVDGAQFASVEQSMFCTAWMIQTVADESDKPSMVYKTEKLEMTLENTTYDVFVPCLVSVSDVFCSVREQDDGHYAVLKRGLL